VNPADFRWDPWTDTAQPTDITNERRTIPASSPYDIRLWEVPQKTQPSSITVKLVDPLAVNITSTSATSITVTHGAWFQNGDVILIDTEKMQLTDAPSGNVLTVSRGYGGTTASTHTSGADVFLDTKFTERSAAPATREYWPDYNADVAADENWNTGTLRFSSDDAGKTIAVTYKGMGNLADARVLRRGVTVYDTPGTYTYIVPDVGLPLTPLLISGTGGGANGSAGGQSTAGAGGGAGQDCLDYPLQLLPGTSVTVTIGNSAQATSFGAYLTLSAGTSNTGEASIIFDASGSGAGPYLLMGGMGQGGPFGGGGKGGYGAANGSAAKGYGAGGGGGGGQMGSGPRAGGAGAPGLLIVRV
jgi:hypothetical protein